MNKSLQYWTTKLNELGLVGIVPVEKNKITDLDFVKKQYLLFEKMHSEFIKYLAKNNIKELQYMKLLREDIINMFDGICPENSVLVFKILPEFGGECNHSNILLMPKHNSYDEIIQFYQEQMLDNDFNFPEKFYNIDYPKSVYYPNYKLKFLNSSSIPERIEEMEI